jgi:tRNA pseudouridine55 synthase
MDGFICVNKPAGPSSFAIVRDVKRALGIKKVGHAGTLDPMASGLLVVAIGNCTRLLEYLTLEPKVYEFSVVFGKSTDTLDAEGNVVAESDVVPSESQLRGILKDFTGEIEQTPPQYSAIKIDGVRAYDLARKGVEVEMKSRNITVYSIDLCGYDNDNRRADFIVGCSAGTYVRSLGRDMAKAVGAEGFLSRIHRTKTGVFDLSMAVSREGLKDAREHIISTDSAFDVNQKVIITNDQKKIISNGKEIVISNNEALKDVLIAFDENWALSAALKRVGEDRYHPDKVVAVTHTKKIYNL